MRSRLEGIEWRVRVSGLLALTGLLLELLALRWSHPAAFLAFALIGMPLVGVGVLIFLYSLVSVRR
jgi:hypothetical protein